MMVRRPARGLALLTLLLPSAAWCLGLGDIKVDTALNQPLRAEIRLLSAGPDEIDNMRVSLASQETFDRVGIERPFVLSQLEFKPVEQGGRTMIAVTTKQPVREPFLNFLVEVQWPSGRLLREYTVLLDPPVLMNQRAGAIAKAPAVAPEANVAPARGISREVAAAEEPVPQSPRAQSSMERGSRRATEDVESGSPFSGDEAAIADVSYEVEPGDTLGEIAQQYRTADDVSLSRMMMAILRANPEAFSEGNINNLKTGVILRMPASQDVASLTEEEAVAEVARQNDLWREYRAQVADAVPAQQIDETVAAAPAEGVAEQPANQAEDQAQDQAQAQDPVAQDSSNDGRLKIMATDEGSAEAQAGTEGSNAQDERQTDAALAREFAESRRVEIDALQTKVAQLESMIAKQQRIISLQSEALAGLQERLEEDAAEQIDPAGEVESATADDGAVESASGERAAVEHPKAEAAEMDGAVPGATQGENAGVDSKGVPTAEAPADIVASDASGVSSTAMEPVSMTTPVAEAEAAPRQVQSEVVTAPATATLLEDLFSSPAMLVSIGVGAALLLALIWLIVRRAASNKAETVDLPTYQAEGDGAVTAQPAAMDVKAQEAPANPEPAESKVAAPAASAGAGSIASTATMKKPTAEAQGNAVADDTLAEADVYIAYGLHQQAEDLMQEAIRRNPTREDYHVKLMEVYYAARNQADFDAQARALHEASGGKRGAAWDRVVAMGKDLSPNNPLFGGEELMSFGASAGVTSSSAITFGTQPDEPRHGMAADVAPRADSDLLDLEPGEAPRSFNDAGHMGAAADQTRVLNFNATDLEATIIAKRPGEAPSATARMDEAALDFDRSDLELVDNPGVTNTDTGAMASSDLGSFDFDAQATALPDNVRTLSTARPDNPQPGDGAEADPFLADDQRTAVLDENVLKLDYGSNSDDLESLMDENEVGTKLDLAKAYIDMGDSDGAKSTLQEVMQEGDDSQRKEAEVLMRQIA